MENIKTIERTQRIRVEFKNKTEEQLKHIFNAEKELKKAGINFDTGYDTRKNRRDWELDWSLEGAEVIIKAPDKS